MFSLLFYMQAEIKSKIFIIKSMGIANFENYYDYYYLFFELVVKRSTESF